MNIIGILHFKDAMKFHTMGKYDNWLIKEYPGTDPGSNDLFRRREGSMLSVPWHAV